MKINYTVRRHDEDPLEKNGGPETVQLDGQHAELEAARRAVRNDHAVVMPESYLRHHPVTVFEGEYVDKAVVEIFGAEADGYCWHTWEIVRCLADETGVEVEIAAVH